MDKPLDRKTRLKKAGRRSLPLFGVGVLVTASVIGVSGFLTPVFPINETSFAKVVRSEMEERFTARGTALPLMEHLVMAPSPTDVKDVLTSPGALVKKGDSLMVLNPATLKKQLQSQKEALALRKVSLEKSGLAARKRLLEMGHQIEIKEIELQEARMELKDVRYLLKLGGSTPYEERRQENTVLLKEKELAMARKRLQIEKEENLADLRNSRLDLAQMARKQDDLEKALEELLIKAPENGVVLKLPVHKGQRVSEGQMLLKMADIHLFYVRGQVDAFQARKIHEGNPVQILCGRDTVRGRVEYIRPEVESGMIFFDVYLENPRHESLRPNQEMNMEVVVNTLPESLVLPNRSFYKGGKEQFVFIRREDLACRRKVRFGVSNKDEVQVVEGLKEGEEVVISPTTHVEHLEEVEIK